MPGHGLVTSKKRVPKQGSLQTLLKRKLKFCYCFLQLFCHWKKYCKWYLTMHCLHRYSERVVKHGLIVTIAGTARVILTYSARSFGVECCHTQITPKGMQLNSYWIMNMWSFFYIFIYLSLHFLRISLSHFSLERILRIVIALSNKKLSV